MELNIANVRGLVGEDLDNFRDLIEIYKSHQSSNRLKERYYEGKIRLSEVNLGLALPKGLRGLEIGCAWGAKCVDVLAARSMFDGFIGVNGQTNDRLVKLVLDNNLITEYMKTARDELKYGCTFSTLSYDSEIGCRIRFHSPRTAAAKWDGEKGRISCGFAIIDTRPDNNTKSWVPSLINYYTDDSIYVLEREVDSANWKATRYVNKMGRPLMEPLVWNETSSKPFGRSRIKEPIRRLIQGYVRTIANATIGLEFSTAPQKYLLGVTDAQYDVLIDQKFKQYVGNMLVSTVNPDTGSNPTYGQLPQGSITPHVEMIRVLATQFSAATGLTVTDTGVVSEANPTSADAVLAQTQTLVGMAEQLNASNGNALRNIAVMALAISDNVTIEELPEEDKDIIAHFKNPSLPSVAATADAAIKIASARTGFAQTDTFLEMLGFTQADIRRIKSEETRVRGAQILETEFMES